VAQRVGRGIALLSVTGPVWPTGWVEV